VSIPAADHARLTRIAEAGHLSLNSLMIYAVKLLLTEAAKQDGYVLHLKEPQTEETPGGQPTP